MRTFIKTSETTADLAIVQQIVYTYFYIRRLTNPTLQNQSDNKELPTHAVTFQSPSSIVISLSLLK